MSRLIRRPIGLFCLVYVSVFSSGCNNLDFTDGYGEKLQSNAPGSKKPEDPNQLDNGSGNGPSSADSELAQKNAGSAKQECSPSPDAASAGGKIDVQVCKVSGDLARGIDKDSTVGSQIREGSSATVIASPNDDLKSQNPYTISIPMSGAQTASLFDPAAFFEDHAVLSMKKNADGSFEVSLTRKGLSITEQLASVQTKGARIIQIVRLKTRFPALFDKSKMTVWPANANPELLGFMALLNERDPNGSSSNDDEDENEGESDKKGGSGGERSGFKH